MKRGTKCIAQTINLSNPETCVRPRKIQKLIDAESQPCPRKGSTPFWTPRPVAVKVCSRKDMQRTCPPKLCDCPPKPPPKTFGQRLCGTLLFLLKSGVAAGLVYWTHAEGLWGSSDDVEDFYQRILATISPASGDEETCPENTSTRLELFKQNLVHNYNRALFTTMNCISSASSKLREQLERVVSDKEEEKVEEKAKDDEDS
ncbi:uncharacterized protein LOC143210474 [Lasioglossum baleicum]|uniref:uncharacterized protein LOC143210474 n=1 Tax=Lasioglossum baleicum TaxID=434251 RepID=UPI003FCD4ED0